MTVERLVSRGYTNAEKTLAASYMAGDTVAFQRKTVDTVIAAMEANHPHLTTEKSFYVEVSCARDQAELVTDDREALREQLETAPGERIAALEAAEPNKVKGREAGLEASQGCGSERDLGL